MKILALLLLLPITAQAMPLMSMRDPAVVTHALPPMPPHCDTPKVMDLWYTEVAQQSRKDHHSIAECEIELKKLGATSNVDKVCAAG